MVRRTSRKRVDPSRAGRYRDVARALMSGAEALSMLAEQGDPYGNPMALLAVHGTIAYTDALTVAYGGVKSTEGDHDAIVPTLQEALRHRASEPQLKALRAVLQEKDAIAYQGESYALDDGREVLARAQSYCKWAEEMYQRRPTG